MPTRREILAMAAAGPVAAALGRAAAAQAPPRAPGYPGLVVRMRVPENLEAPISGLDTFQTPVERHYVRNHFPVPALDLAQFTLTVEGAVEKPLTLSLSELARLGEVEMPLTLECAGNGRVNLVPPARGLQWGHGAVGTATWGGVPLAKVLEAARVKSSAVEVVLVGADRGVIADPASPGAIAFDRSLPLAKAQKPEVILATRMNGEPLPASHGAPLRAVVGGWYGMASVKWLTRVVVTESPYAGFWQTLDYAIFTRSAAGLPTLTAVTEMQPKAVIRTPTLGEVVRVGQRVRVAGAAWAHEPVERVEFSADAGKTWTPAALSGPRHPFCWRMWECDWTPISRGPAQLLARCTDTMGRTQPTERDPDRRTYLINHLVPTDVLVR